MVCRQQVSEEKDSLLLSFPVTDYREVLGDILRFGADAEVLEPAELRELIAATVAAMSACTAPDAGRPGKKIKIFSPAP